MSEKNLIEQFKAARRVGTPIIAIHTSDQPATIAEVGKALPTKSGVIQWDCVRGWMSVNREGSTAIGEALNVKPDSTGEFSNEDAMKILTCTQVPGEMLGVYAPALPAKTVLFILNAQRFLHEPQIIQAIANLRDQYKQDFRTIVLIGPAIDLPAELGQDVLVLDEPLPDAAALELIIHEVVEESAKQTLTKEQKVRAVDAVRGLPAFAAESVTAMSLSKDELNIDTMWERKRQMIETTPGLSVWRGTEKFADIGGVSQIKEFLRRVIKGKESPRVIVFIDEIEKMLAGAVTGGGDTSGISQDFLQNFLTEMQNNRYTGTIFIGPPGAAKSVVAKAAGNEAEIPTIVLDTGAAKEGIVGESEKRLRQAFKVIKAVGGGRALFIATCNQIGTLPPELRRRFTRGTWFFDLPTAEERAMIWPIYLKRYSLNAKQADDVNADNWTGAEIESCCRQAWDFGCTLQEASQYIVPVAVAAKDQIERLRSQADRKFLSASAAGIYLMDASATAAHAASPARTTGARRGIES